MRMTVQLVLTGTSEWHHRNGRKIHLRELGLVVAPPRELGSRAHRFHGSPSFTSTVDGLANPSIGMKDKLYPSILEYSRSGALISSPRNDLGSWRACNFAMDPQVDDAECPLDALGVISHRDSACLNLLLVQGRTVHTENGAPRIPAPSLFQPYIQRQMAIKSEALTVMLAEPRNRESPGILTEGNFTKLRLRLVFPADHGRCRERERRGRFGNQ